jgi:hypothetical protein
VAVLLAGLSFSGSRVGFFGSLLMAVFCLVFTTNGFRNLLFLALGGALVLTWAGSLQQWTGGMTTSRSTNAEGLFTRVRDSYLGELLHNGYEASGGIGLGWGPVTMGVIIYLDGFGLTENWPEAGQLEGGYSVLIAEGGVVGLILFVGLHLELWRYPAAGMPAFFAPGIALWSLIGNLPLHLQGIPAISILWWFLVGFCIALSDRPMDVPAYAHRPG